LGTPRQLVNASGAVVWQAAYLPYGEAQVQANNAITNNLRFPGQYFDAETGLHYNWNRYYDPITGRYISADPIGLKGGLNLYGYVDGNPVNWIDPEGTNPLAVIGTISAAYGFMKAIERIQKRYYQAQIFQLLDDQENFLKDQMRRLRPDECAQFQLLKEELEDIVLQKAILATEVGFEELGSAYKGMPKKSSTIKR